MESESRAVFCVLFMATTRVCDVLIAMEDVNEAFDLPIRYVRNGD